MRHVLSREQLVPRPRPQVFAFFADAANLERLTPPNLKFSIQTSLPIAMLPGAIIDYRLSLFRVPFRWRTVIEVFEPGSRFIDVQAKGPYALWRHLHEFIDAPGGTLARDRVEYALPLGPLGDLAHALFVRRQLEQIFDFRRGIIERVFAREQDMPPQPAAPLR